MKKRTPLEVLVGWVQPVLVARTLLRLEHRELLGLGGVQTTEALGLRCATYNAIYADEIYGKRRIATAIVTLRARRYAK